MRHIILWKFAVRSDKVPEFVRAYGSDGAWVRLFRRGKGFISTQLVRDAVERDVFVTVDVWVSNAAYQAFRSLYAAEYEELDHLCESLTLREEKLAEGESCSAATSEETGAEQ